MTQQRAKSDTPWTQLMDDCISSELSNDDSDCSENTDYEEVSSMKKSTKKKVPGKKGSKQKGTTKKAKPPSNSGGWRKQFKKMSVKEQLSILKSLAQAMNA